MPIVSTGAPMMPSPHVQRANDAALDVGITSIDSAPMYDLGACERTVGEAIRGARKNSRPESVRLEVERSLERLGCDVLDTVHVHIRDPLIPIADTMGALKNLLREGKIRAIGVSTNFGPREIAQAQLALGDVTLASLQVGYNLLERRCETDLIPIAQDDSIAVLARSPLAMGLLKSKIGPWSSFSRSDLRRNMPTFHLENLRRISIAVQHGIAPIAADRGVSVATAHSPGFSIGPP